jgi:hypothetical protein
MTIKALKFAVEAYVDGASGSQWRTQVERTIRIRAYMIRYLLDAGVNSTDADSLVDTCLVP